MALWQPVLRPEMLLQYQAAAISCWGCQAVLRCNLRAVLELACCTSSMEDSAGVAVSDACSCCCPAALQGQDVQLLQHACCNIPNASRWLMICDKPYRFNDAGTACCATRCENLTTVGYKRIKQSKQLRDHAPLQWRERVTQVVVWL